MRNRFSVRFITVCLCFALCTAFAMATSCNEIIEEQTDDNGMNTVLPEQTTLPETDEPTTAPTADPLLGKTILYGGSVSWNDNAEPSPRTVEWLGAFTDEILDRAAEDGSLFAVKISVNDYETAKLFHDRIANASLAEPIRERYVAYCIWCDETGMEWGTEECHRYCKYPEYVEILFEDHWRKTASEEDQQAYDDAVARWDEVLKEAYGKILSAEAERLIKKGLLVEYDGEHAINGYLTAEQIRDFPVSDEYGMYLYWQLDPELTAEKIIAAEGLNTPD